METSSSSSSRRQTNTNLACSSCYLYHCSNTSQMKSCGKIELINQDIDGKKQIGKNVPFVVDWLAINFQANVTNTVVPAYQERGFVSEGRALDRWSDKTCCEHGIFQCVVPWREPSKLTIDLFHDHFISWSCFRLTVKPFCQQNVEIGPGDIIKLLLLSDKLTQYVLLLSLLLVQCLF